MDKLSEHRKSKEMNKEGLTEDDAEILNKFHNTVQWREPLRL